jgi:hypothetical protein
MIGSPTEVTRRVEPFPTTNEEGSLESNRWKVDILLADGVVWCEASELVTENCLEGVNRQAENFPTKTRNELGKIGSTGIKTDSTRLHELN